MLALVDQANNPLPAGVYVAVYPFGAAFKTANLVGSGWTQAGGLCSITVQAALTYTAVFVGVQAPGAPATFAGQSGNTTTVTVQGYRSPSLSQSGYAIEQANKWPSGPGWFGSVARSPGGIAYAVAYGIAGAIASLDLSAQSELQRLRLWSSAGLDIDSWAADFLDGWFPRIAGESDSSFMARIYSLLSGQVCTLAGIQNAVQLFYNAIALQLGEQANQNLTFDYEGSFDEWGSFDVSQGFSAVDTTVTAWDSQSEQALAQLFGILPPQFVIQLGSHPPNAEQWFLDHSHLDFETFLINDVTYTLSPTAPDPRLAALVTLLKAPGTQPMYLVTSET